MSNWSTNKKSRHNEEVVQDITEEERKGEQVKNNPRDKEECSQGIHKEIQHNSEEKGGQGQNNSKDNGEGKNPQSQQKLKRVYNKSVKLHVSEAFVAEVNNQVRIAIEKELEMWKIKELLNKTIKYWSVYCNS